MLEKQNKQFKKIISEGHIAACTGRYFLIVSRFQPTTRMNSNVICIISFFDTPPDSFITNIVFFVIFKHCKKIVSLL